MSELKNSLSGITCEATIEAFEFLQSKKRKPYIVETPTANYIRVSIGGKRFDYSPTTGAWMPTKDRGRREWNEAESVSEFYSWAEKVASHIYPPTPNMQRYINALLSRTGEEMTPGALDSFKSAGNEISRLKEIEEQKQRPKKPRLSLQEFRAYSFIDDLKLKGNALDINNIASDLGYTVTHTVEIIRSLIDRGLIKKDVLEITPYTRQSQMVSGH